MVCSLFICRSLHTKTAVKVHYLWPKTQFGFQLSFSGLKIPAKPIFTIIITHYELLINLVVALSSWAYDKHRQRNIGKSDRSQSG